MRGIFNNPKPPGGPLSLAVMTVGCLASPLRAPLVALPPPVPAYQPRVRLLSPGNFVRIRLPIGQPYHAQLVIDRAVQSDQGRKYVYVVDAENKASTCRITTGAVQEDGLRVVSKGLKPSDWVVVGNIQQVRPSMVIKPDQITMPSLAPQPSVPDKETGRKG